MTVLFKEYGASCSLLLTVLRLYIGCPIISETALRTDRERDLSANHGTTRIPQSITDTTSHQ